jgi:hypothetical protein
VITHADAAVFTAITTEGCVQLKHAHDVSLDVG